MPLGFTMAEGLLLSLSDFILFLHKISKIKCID